MWVLPSVGLVTLIFNPNRRQENEFFFLSESCLTQGLGKFHLSPATFIKASIHLWWQEGFLQGKWSFSFLSAWVVTGLCMGSDKHWTARTCGSCHFKLTEAKCSDAGECIRFLLRQLPTPLQCVSRMCPAEENMLSKTIYFLYGQSVKPGRVFLS